MSDERLEAIRRASRERTRQWHEQLTAAGRCHRCRRLVDEAGWYCRRCRRYMAQQRAFLRDVQLLAAGQCVECRQRHDDVGKWRCKACTHKVLYARRLGARSLPWPHATAPPVRAVASVRPAPGRQSASDSHRAVAV